ncbi:MAG: DUF1194 domain-containing protein, partial [Halobacteriota archaeon]
WTVINSAVEAYHFARHLESRPRETARNTDLAASIRAALDLFETSTLCARRLVIDISADGKETLYPRRRIGPSMQNARLRANAMGVTINVCQEYNFWHQRLCHRGKRSELFFLWRRNEAEASARNKTA